MEVYIIHLLLSLPEVEKLIFVTNFNMSPDNVCRRLVVLFHPDKAHTRSVVS